jgi:polar amino acid transport system substrate-binding protein
MAQKKKNCLIYSILRSPQRETLFKWIRPLAAIKTVYLYRLRSNKELNPTTIEKARSYPIIAQRDSLDHLWLKSNGFKNIYLTPDVSQIVQLLLRGSRSLIVYSNIALPVEIKKQGGSMEQVVAVLPLLGLIIRWATYTGTQLIAPSNACNYCI